MKLQVNDILASLITWQALVTWQDQAEPDGEGEILFWLFLFFLAGLGGLLFSCLVAWEGFQNWRRARASVSWPHSIGKIEEAVVDSDDDGRYFTIVRFRYHVDGLPYFGSVRMSLRKGTREQARAESEASYPVGREWKVYFDPHNKEGFTLSRPTKKPGVHFLALIWGFSLVLFGLSIWSIVYGISKFAKLG